VTTGARPALAVFLCGDVMTGRGVDQILPHPGDPALREPVVADARTYVALAEKSSGPIPRPADFAWPWGQALSLIDDFAPDVRLINLETAITADGRFAQGKSVHYRMHPDNIACLTVIRPDVCALANNHILDFGYRGLADTLDALGAAGMRGAGAGLDAQQANGPVVVTRPHGARAVIVSCGMESSGIPRRWAAKAGRPGVAFVSNLSNRKAADIAERALERKRPGDVAIASVHWGPNWGYQVNSSEVRFAHRLIDSGIDVVHGHSSHHPRPIELYHGRLILYGCGDMIDDYEGIQGYEAYRDDLRLLYFASVERASGELIDLRMIPMQTWRMRLRHACGADAEWMRSMLEEISRRFGTRVECTVDGTLTVRGV
jgi:poly-gamma-glutamate capsule biosynthesis protein CapA/YwtB (metallophosphatase superfamily)